MSSFLSGTIGTLWMEKRIDRFLDQRTTQNTLKRAELLLTATTVQYLGREVRDRAADEATKLLGVDTDGLRSYH